MAINTAANAASYRKLRADLKQAATYTHRDLSASGTTRQRAEKVMKVRAEFVSKIPSPPDPVVLQDRRPAVIESLAPKNADQVAVQGHEWAKVQAILKTGRPLQQVIVESTNAARLAAIASNIEAWAYEQSASRRTNDPEGVAADLRGMVFDRLVEVGHEDAMNANSTQEMFAAQAAWARVLEEAVAGQVTLGALTALFQNDPEGYREVAAANAEFDPAGDVSRTIQHLDGLIGSGQIPAGG